MTIGCSAWSSEPVQALCSTSSSWIFQLSPSRITDQNQAHHSCVSRNHKNSSEFLKLGLKLSLCILQMKDNSKIGNFTGDPISFSPNATLLKRRSV